MRFLDTNILLYAVSRAPSETAKRDCALALLEANDWVISVQVLQEFYVQATRTTKSDRLLPQQAAALVESWLRFRVLDITVPILQAAMQASDTLSALLLGRCHYRSSACCRLLRGLFRRPERWAELRWHSDRQPIRLTNTIQLNVPGSAHSDRVGRGTSAPCRGRERAKVACDECAGDVRRTVVFACPRHISNDRAFRPWHRATSLRLPGSFCAETGTFLAPHRHLLTLLDAMPPHRRNLGSATSRSWIGQHVQP